MRPTTDAGAARRDAIVRRAAEIGSLEGLEGLTIGRLARELRMSKSGLFDYFGSKEALQLATVEHATATLRREVVEPATAALPGLERLRALLEGYVAYLEREVFPGGCFLSAAAAEFDGRPGVVRDAIATATRAWSVELQSQVEVGLAHGELAPETDPEQLVFELASYANQANAAFQLYRDPEAFAHARRAIARAVKSAASRP
jgi:AcrR family transcriptional regulator